MIRAWSFGGPAGALPCALSSDAPRAVTRRSRVAFIAVYSVRNERGCQPALFAGPICRLIGERELERDALLRPRDFGDVAFAGDIFDQVNVPRPDRNLFTSGDFELRMAGQRNYVLAARSAMPIDHISRRCQMELARCDRQQF